MKTLKTLALVAATVLFASCSCGQKECKFNAKKYAECKTEKLDQLVDLDDAQEKAVYAVYLKEGKAIANKIKECKKAECAKPCDKKCDKPACEKKCDKPACDKKAECNKECNKPCEKKCDKPCEKKCDKPCDKKVGCKKQACKATCEEIGAILTPAQKEALKANCKPCKKAECEKPCAKKEECTKPCDKKCDKTACDKKGECKKECTKPCDKKAECNK